MVEQNHLSGGVTGDKEKPRSHEAFQKQVLGDPRALP